MALVAERSTLANHLRQTLPRLFPRDNVILDHSVNRARKRADEIRSPVFPGVTKAVEAARALAKCCAWVGVPLSRSCGFHVHVGFPPDVDVLDGFAAVITDWIRWQNAMFEMAYGRWNW